ncbi:zinc finger protein 462 [Megalops cyprinoides]|uniref:zinc finger protein 462 n=1 Tax=Megalops cyprinoides TaxID=118141 RepID=UPI001864D0C9|nr:zinc finger protein 462 [Megalops cyprinoides]XP_036384212.1 zinc finger protein 462 [Megalops cyprinoides]XP_036384213.1 zinc finger protein 462 [Megalops cyprinoides]XP_036384214.1 zinc finger protein 462 [Megalops cyprinoides]
MEVLQCDGCDFRAESYDDLKAHIQDVHTAFLQPTAVGDGTPSHSRSDSLNSLSQAEEDEEDLASLNNEFETPHEQAGPHSFDSGQFSSSNQMTHNQTVNQPAKPANQFFQCKFCIRYFRSKSLLNEHTRKVHGIVGGASVSGENSPASQSSNFNILMHDGFGKVFSCQYCTYKSPRRARILKHQKMYHKSHLLDSPGSPPEAVTESSSNALFSEESCSDLPEEVVERSILESMVKPLTKSRGNFSCEWCGYQTLRRERWCDHMMKKHRNMVKIISSIQEPQEGEGSVGSSKPNSPSSPRTPNSNLIINNLSGNEGSSANTSNFKGSSGNTMLKSTGQASKISSYDYSQMKSKIPNSTGSSILSERSTFAMSDMSNFAMDLDTDIILNESGSSSDEELGDIDDPNNPDSSAGDSAKQPLSEEDNKMLETKGIPFRRYMNRFQCPFCSFLTMHRRSISRHIENIHLSGKTTVYKCDECPFICTSPLKLGTHKQCHMGSSSDWDPLDLPNESPGGQNELTEPINGGNLTSKINGKKSGTVNEVNQQNPYHCTLCSFSTTTLKGLRVHQQHKHSYCDNMQPASHEGSSNEQQDSESETYSSPNYVKKTQTSILGFSSKKHLINKTARKSINDLPLDLSPVKKRTRIDEIANNLQSKISKSKQQEDTVINLEEIDDEEEEEDNEVEMFIDEDDDDSQTEHQLKNQSYSFDRQPMHLRESVDSQEEGIAGKKKHSLQSKFISRNIPIQLSISDDEDNETDYGAPVESKDLQDRGSQDSRDACQENLDYNEDAGTLFYCKHCEYQNKSARSVSTHYQRMHPYIKFSFRYILDPEDQSAVFRCLECYIEYTTFDDLNQHYMEHHPEAINVLNFNQPDLVYRCRFCSYTSPNVRSLMPHYQRMHPTVKINNAMIFSSYVVEQPQKGESQTLREILNSGPKSFTASSPVPRSSAHSSPVHKSISKMQESSTETDAVKETTVNNVVVYDCDICSFASPNMHSVLVHYQKKHPEQKASYFRIQKTMRVVSVDRSQTSSNTSYSMNTPNPPKASNVSPFGADEEIYYCKHCVYSNRSVVGVLVHYQKRHPEIKVTAKYIKHAPPTPGLMKLMDELQIAPPKQFLKQFSNNGIDSSGISHARLGGDKGEAEMLFFCQHCDYGNRTVKGVLIHYQKKHRDVKVNADLVRRHTAVVRSQRERAQMIQSGGMSVSASVSDTDKTRALRSLKCRHCSYTSPYVYALKKHLKKDHPTVKATAMTILHWAYQDGILEAGYHCEWCIYSHAEPNGLLMHYQRRHPEHNVDYTYMASKLWAGPDSSSSQRVGNSDTKHYQCRDCAFEACTIWDITNHYQAVHPWAIKRDESVLLDIIKGNHSSGKSQTPVAKGHVSMARPLSSHHPEQDEESFDVTRPSTEMVPHLSFASTSISNNPYQCTVCLSEYNSLHGLLTHYGKKHPGMKVKAADFAQEADINPSSVYKCRHCPYVNSRIHGVLTHYQKRHPLVKVTAEDFADDIEQVKDLNDGDEKCKSQRQGYGAYRCKMCPYTHGTLEKLRIHYENYHNQSASDMFNPPHMQFSASKDDPVAECSGASVTEVPDVSDFHLALSQFPIDKGAKHAIFRCQLCKYFCSTRKGIARHYRIKHNNVRAQPEGKNNVFKCALCSYTNPIRKGLAAHYQKRHDIDAYYTHCLAASKSISDKPNKVVVPVSSQSEGPELSEELRQAVERRKCSLCSFQAFSKKSIVSHYIKRHPGVFPKRQNSSKLGRYFTVVYAKEPENLIAVEEKKVTEDQSETELEKDLERLPFKCLKCFKLSFNTAELLCMHYTDYHSKDLKRDFCTLASPAQDGVDCYQCAHCDLKFLGLLDLSTHLINHNEEFQKRAMRQERRKQLLSKQKGSEPPENKPEKVDTPSDKTPVGYRCNFCVEVHPTLRAICNHLRKHVQYGEVKAGHVKQEVTEIPLPLPVEGEANGDVADVVAVEPDPVEMISVVAQASVTPAPVAMETAEVERGPREVVAMKERAVGGHPCGQCDRVFMSMQGLRSHERSHSAMALFTREDKYNCQYCQFASPFRHNLDRHVQSHHGHHKPFRCKLCSFKSSYLSRLKSHLYKAHAGENTYKCLSCSFSTMTISQLKEHSLKAHGEALTLPKLRAATQAAFRSHRPTQGSEQTLVISETDEPAYLEPPDVQQQLSRYQLASRNQASSSPPVLPVVEARLDGTLTCEFCEFSSGYMQSLRRHYRDRHGGKKLFKCKDCSFFTCYKSTFTMHVEAGHASTPEEGPKDLRCPLCLYHTKYKSNMIDHIVLHREERVVPLEVCRSKLSRHLQGVVFRCHKCTFTCSSDESLQLHIHKHDELKPYQCQLCYYDTKQREDLEAHLRNEHKVIRNFELAGRVNLDQLEAVKDKMGSLSSAEEEEEGEEEEEENEEEEEAEKPDSKDAPGSPNSSVSACSEKRFPCEFCGRSFTHSTEWERHVLRHGMTVTNRRAEASSAEAIEAATQTEVSSQVAAADRGGDFPSDTMEAEGGYPPDLAQCKVLKEEDSKTPETKNDP